jgi:hypothetical protein
MLLVDPLKRITIPEIRQHPWFTAHLPRYLAVMQADAANSTPRIDDDMVVEVVKLGEWWWCVVVTCGGGGADVQGRRLAYHGRWCYVCGLAGRAGGAAA